VPAAQEKDRDQGPQHLHVHVFPQEKQAEAHAAVLGVKTRAELVFRLGQVEGDALAFRQRAYEENCERHGLDQDEGPVGLGPHDLHQAERAGLHDDGDEG